MWWSGVRTTTLARGVEDVVRAGRRLDLEFLPEPTLGSTLFLQTLPLGFDPAWPKETYLRRARRLPGANLAQLLPLYGGFRGTTTASILYLNQRGEAVSFDPFDSPTAPHMLVTGTSGSGKSFLMAHLVQQVLPLGAQVVILDRLPSYQELCAVWQGQYVAMDFNAPVCFNPFYGAPGQGPRRLSHRLPGRNGQWRRGTPHPRSVGRAGGCRRLLCRGMGRRAVGNPT